MAQVTWRASEELVERVRDAARREQRSMNDFVSHVLDTVTNPEAAGSERERLRERLAKAGLLADPVGPPRTRPDPERVAEARKAAGRGKPLSDFVSEGRGERLR